jgi:hypothetical protein
MTGIWQSMSTASKRARSTAATASTPLVATSTSAPTLASIARTTSWFAGLSSTSSTRPRSGPVAAAPSARDAHGALVRSVPSSAPRSAFKSSPRRTGLVSHTPMSTSWRTASPSRSPTEVNITSRVGSSSGSARIAVARAIPSRSGMWRSRMAIANGAPLATAFDSSGSTSRGSDTAVTSIPQLSSWWLRISRLVALSSMISTRWPASARMRSARSSPRRRAQRIGRVSVNREPRPSSLSTAMLPPMSPTSWRQIASPSPVPP